MPDIVDGLPVSRREAWLLQSDALSPEWACAVLERPLTLLVNGSRLAILMRTPGQEIELAKGFLLSEGLVRCADALHDWVYEPGSFDGSEEDRVLTQVAAKGLAPNARLDVLRLVRAVCGATELGRDTFDLMPVASPVRFSFDLMRGLGQALREVQQLRAVAGGVHAVGLASERGEMVAAAEDVGRHNALDKAIGQALGSGDDLSCLAAVCSGRLSYEMVAKAARMGIPLLASFSAPTALAIDLATALNVTLVGRLGSPKSTVYTHPERLTARP